MINSIRISGTLVTLKARDFNRDGVTGGTEELSRDNPIITAKDSTELGDAITEFNRDDVSEDRLSSIDFRSRIDPFEMQPMVALDALIGMSVIPVQCGILNRVKMRKSVSISGQGRKEFVDIVVGKREDDENKLKKGFKNLMGGNNEHN
jgi:hypothetical protein